LAKKNNKKINNGCLNIFKFLSLLYEDNAYYDKVIRIFNEEVEARKNPKITQVVLNKYINALRVFGIKIIKKNNKYEFESSLYSLNYTLDDLKSISMLLNAANNFPDKEISGNFRSFASELLLRMNNPDKKELHTLQTNYDFSFFYTDFKTQIEKCRNYCKNNQILNITFLSNGRETKIKCSAKEMIYDNKTAYLKVYNMTSNENVEIALPNILSIEVQPQKASASAQTMTVVYKLKGRLAKSYRLKENEYLDRKENDEIYVVNKDEPMDKLLARLMRYSFSCEIISPKYLRNKMIDLINQTINLYK